MKLSMHVVAWLRTGLVSGQNERVIEYRVQGQSPDDEAFIADFGSWQTRVWKILRVKNQDGWTGQYATANEAFALLQTESEKPGARQ